MTDLSARLRAAPLDPDTVATLGASGLKARVVDVTSRPETDAWLQAVARGFLDGERNDVQREAFFGPAASRRKIGVYDADTPEPHTPVATFASWATELTVPGGRVPAAAISAVTVAPTHRRRGILRALMAGELRTALAEGMPVAALTVSESTIYGRFGFAPAAASTSWTINARRAGWVGPLAPGRIDFLSREQALGLAPALHERMRVELPGEVEIPSGHWERLFGTRVDSEKADSLRAVQYRSASGSVDGIALYRASENEADYSASAVDLLLVLPVTDEAYAGLWRFLLSMDLIATVRASELSTDEPLWWMIADQRAATITVRDHHYLRVLDVAEALQERRFAVADRAVLHVTDALGIASGDYLLETDAGGAGRVTRLTAGADDAAGGAAGAAHVHLGVAELSAILLGGVSPVTLARAGRLRADDPPRLARLFASAVTPRLSFWY